MKKIIFAVIAVALLAAGFGFYNKVNSLNTASVEYETGLNQHYQSDQLELDTYVKTIKESVGIANVKSDKLDQILRDAVSGRYGDTRDSLDGPRNGQGGTFMSAIVEAYPDIKGQLDVYDRIVDKVFSGREAFKKKQDSLLADIREYDAWRNTGLIQSFIIKKVVGSPTDLLEARVGTSVKRGQAALDQMKLVVTSGATNDAFNTGKDEAIEIPGSKK